MARSQGGTKIVFYSLLIFSLGYSCSLIERILNLIKLKLNFKTFVRVKLKKWQRIGSDALSHRITLRCYIS